MKNKSEMLLKGYLRSQGQESDFEPEIPGTTRPTYIHRVNTIGGIAPNTECNPAERRALVQYEAVYYFYRQSGRP